MIHLLFNIGVISKGVDGVLEVLGGVLLCFMSPAQIQSILRMLTQHELAEDPHDLLAGYLLHVAQHFSASVQIFAAAYLVWHGIVKVGLVVALLRKRLWAYPAATGAFVLFLIYQLYRYAHTRSAWLLMISAVDVFVIVITWLEYKRLRALRESARSAGTA
jgi:uncharacterized membrane protein